MVPLFLTGMFRSGTTTLARALNAHNSIAFASDPFNEVLKAFRSQVALHLGQDVPVMAPLADYYFDKEGQELLKELLENATLEIPFDVWSQDQLLKRLIPRCEAYSGALTPFLGNMEGSTYLELLNSLLGQVNRAYGDSTTAVVGFKEVWTTEFVPALARGWPTARFLVMERDPRAVSASKNVGGERYPWTFLTRQWRKQAGLDYLFGTMPDLSSRILRIYYEDFVLNPEETTERICNFLQIPWDPAMADPSVYRDGDGALWRQNTSYGVGGCGFDKAALDRWREALTDRELQLIEFMVGPEMRLHGYIPETEGWWKEDRTLLLDPPRIRDEEKAKWMKGVVPNDFAGIAKKISEEFIRAALFSCDCPHDGGFPEDLVKEAFLDKKIFQAVKKNSPQRWLSD